MQLGRGGAALGMLAVAGAIDATLSPLLTERQPRNACRVRCTRTADPAWHRWPRLLQLPLPCSSRPTADGTPKTRSALSGCFFREAPKGGFGLLGQPVFRGTSRNAL